MAIVYGFGGVRLKEEGLFFAPSIPDKWLGYKFKINYEGSEILVDANRDGVTFYLVKGMKKVIYVYGKKYELSDISLNIKY